MRQSEVFDAAESLLLTMMGLCTNGEVDDANPDYGQLRAAVMNDPVGRQHAPRVVRTCRDPSALWSYMKGVASGSGSWDARRKYLRDEFEPLLSALEQFEVAPSDALVREAAAKLNSESVTAAWTKALERRHREPDAAITAARTLLESTCKTILDDASVDYTAKDDLPKLYRKVCTVLKLHPSEHTEELFKRILGGCANVVEGLGSVRNAEGDAHGQGRKSYRPAARHAALAVNLAGSMALFLMETDEAGYAERYAEELAEDETDPNFDADESEPW